MVHALIEHMDGIGYCLDNAEQSFATLQALLDEHELDWRSPPPYAVRRRGHRRSTHHFFAHFFFAFLKAELQRAANPIKRVVVKKSVDESGTTTTA
ncbi:MAG: hypothetical protein IV100_14545, partial [Myxococcales bacterium]|nr:hypothetical protein [Myxococcales bacterium]